MPPFFFDAAFIFAARHFRHADAAIIFAISMIAFHAIDAAIDADAAASAIDYFARSISPLSRCFHFARYFISPLPPRRRHATFSAFITPIAFQRHCRHAIMPLFHAISSAISPPLFSLIFRHCFHFCFAMHYDYFHIVAAIIFALFSLFAIIAVFFAFAADVFAVAIIAIIFAMPLFRCRHAMP